MSTKSDQTPNASNAGRVKQARPQRPSPGKEWFQKSRDDVPMGNRPSRQSEDPFRNLLASTSKPKQPAEPSSNSGKRNSSE